MNNLIIDAAADKIFLSLIIDKNIYTCSHENSKSNFEKLIILITNFLNKNKTSINKIDKIYVNRGPGSFAGIRNSISVVKAFNVAKKIDYYCYSLDDFEGEIDVRYENIPDLCKKYNIKKNLINPVYIS